MMARSVYLLLLLVLAVEGARSPYVQLRHGGKLKGSAMKSVQGKPIAAFRGIPYAESPSGELRFKPPVAKAPWQKVLDATQDGEPCPQMGTILTTAYVGQEDCLSLNVYTTQLPDEDDDKDDLLPVMVFIHGGAFVYGSSASTFYGPTKLMDGDIVLVVINYRLGALGFLSTGDSASPGNYGLLDQNLALKWVQENIDVFGGDPTRVTLFGESAGSASVGMHLFSPLSSGLFHRAITQSGAPICSWAIGKNPLYWAQRLAKDVGCPPLAPTDELVTCLRNVSEQALAEAVHPYFAVSFVPMPFPPVVDGYFLPEHPRSVLASGEVTNPVPVISGITQEEGAMFYGTLFKDFGKDKSHSPELILDFLRYRLHDEGTAEDAARHVVKHYFSGSEDEKQRRATFIDVMSEGSFEVCHYEFLHQLVQAGVPTYAYSFDFVSSINILSLYGIDEHLGVGHAAELLSLFQLMIDVPGLPPPSDQDNKMSVAMTRMWTNFAKAGNPTPKLNEHLPMKWPLANASPTAANSINVFHINFPFSSSTYDVATNARFRFWTELLAESESEKSQEQQTRKEEL